MHHKRAVEFIIGFFGQWFWLKRTIYSSNRLNRPPCMSPLLERDLREQLGESESSAAFEPKDV
ncbi:MAG: hypothetical protein ACUVRP_06435 [Chlorobiales bacterium]